MGFRWRVYPEGVVQRVASQRSFLVWRYCSVNQEMLGRLRRGNLVGSKGTSWSGCKFDGDDFFFFAQWCFCDLSIAKYTLCFLNKFSNVMLFFVVHFFVNNSKTCGSSLSLCLSTLSTKKYLTFSVPFLLFDVIWSYLETTSWRHEGHMYQCQDERDCERRLAGKQRCLLSGVIWAAAGWHAQRSHLPLPRLHWRVERASPAHVRCGYTPASATIVHSHLRQWQPANAKGDIGFHWQDFLLGMTIAPVLSSGLISMLFTCQRQYLTTIWHVASALFDCYVRVFTTGAAHLQFLLA